MFCLTGANVDDRDPKVWAVLGKRIYGKLFADRGYISPNLFDALFLPTEYIRVTGIRNNMKNKLDATLGQDHAQKKVYHRVH